MKLLPIQKALFITTLPLFIKMINNHFFTVEELDVIYDLVRDQHDDVMRGDWVAVKDDISELHLLMYKILKLQKQEQIND